MKRFAIALTAPVLALGLLTACNGAGSGTNNAAAKTPTHSTSDSASPSGAGSEYCKLLDADWTDMFANIKGPDDAAEAVTAVKKVAAAAPSELRDDWKVLGGTLDQMQGSLTKAAQLQKDAQSGKVGKRALRQKMTKLVRQTQGLSTPKSQAAGTAIAKHAGDYCGISLGG